MSQVAVHHEVPRLESPSRGAQRDLRERPGLCALLPLKLHGRHYGENLARLDLLLSSLLHFAEHALLDELLIVAQAKEARPVLDYVAQWPEIPVRILWEEEHFPAFSRYQRPWQLRPWQRQQIIKLNAPAFTSAGFVLILDPDVIAVKPVSRDVLVVDGRALLQPEDRHVHRRWWEDSARLLGVDPHLDRPGIGVTPAVLSTRILGEVQRQLEAASGRPWMDLLLTSYCDWTEYTLYLLAAEAAGMVTREHVWATDPVAPAHLQVDAALSVWSAADTSHVRVERLFARDEPGLFAVVQSSAGLAANELAAVAGTHFAVRATPSQPLPPVEGRTRAAERVRTLSRLVAQTVWRLRHRRRRRTARV